MNTTPLSKKIIRYSLTALKLASPPLLNENLRLSLRANQQNIDSTFSPWNSSDSFAHHSKKVLPGSCVPASISRCASEYSSRCAASCPPVNAANPFAPADKLLHLRQRDRLFENSAAGHQPMGNHRNHHDH